MTTPGDEEERVIKGIKSAIDMLIQVQSLNKIEAGIFLQAIAHVNAACFRSAECSKEGFLSIMGTTWDMLKDGNEKPS